jgi:hypothetical protein
LSNHKVLEQFTDFVKKSVEQYTDDLLGGMLKSAIKSVQKKEEDIKHSSEQTVQDTEESIEPTAEELEAFMIVKSILYPVIEDINRVEIQARRSNVAILLDGNIRKPICRFHFGGKTKYIIVFDKEKQTVRNDISSMNEIYSLSEHFKNVVEFYMS